MVLGEDTIKKNHNKVSFLNPSRNRGTEHVRRNDLYFITQLGPLVLPVHQNTRCTQSGRQMHRSVLATDTLVGTATPDEVVLGLGVGDRGGTVGLGEPSFGKESIGLRVTGLVM